MNARKHYRMQDAGDADFIGPVVVRHLLDETAIQVPNLVTLNYTGKIPNEHGSMARGILGTGSRSNFQFFSTITKVVI